MPWLNRFDDEWLRELDALRARLRPRGSLRRSAGSATRCGESSAGRRRASASRAGRRAERRPRRCARTGSTAPRSPRGSRRCSGARDGGRASGSSFPTRSRSGSSSTPASCEASRSASAIAWSPCFRAPRGGLRVGAARPGSRSLPVGSRADPRRLRRASAPRGSTGRSTGTLGYYPLAMRLNYRHGFHRERMAPGHPNWMLDSDRDSRLPRWSCVERSMRALALQPASLRPARALPAHAGRVRRARALERPAARRRAVHRRARDGSACRSSRTSRAGITPSARA